MDHRVRSNKIQASFTIQAITQHYADLPKFATTPDRPKSPKQFIQTPQNDKRTPNKHNLIAKAPKLAESN